MDYPNLGEMPYYLLTMMVFSALSFLVFGFSCFFSSFMVTEFERYRLKNFRIPNGILQLMGGMGLILGLKWPNLGLLSAGGLMLLMALGFLVRLKIKDGFVKSFPAFFYMALNLVIFLLLLQLKK